MNFLVYIKRFGILEGLFLYLRVRLKLYNKIQIKEFPYSIHLRKNSTDLEVFKQIVVGKDYHIRLLDKISPNIIVDAGANIGLSTIVFANNFPDSKIFSIEPEISNFELLMKNVENYSNVTPINKALWCSEGWVEIEEKQKGEWGFTVKNVVQKSPESIACTSISKIMETHRLEYIDVLKMDVEGSEKEIFEKDFENWLPKIQVLIIEIHDWMKQGCSKNVFKALVNYDFSYSRQGENLVFHNRNF